MKNAKETIYEYLHENIYMTLATADANGKPEAATVEYVMDGEDLLLNTYTYYRKYQNLLQNPQAACVITTNHDKTLQFDADIQLLKDDEATYAKNKMLEKQPEFAAFFTDSDTRFFRIKPVWMRLRDYTQDPEKVTTYESGQNDGAGDGSAGE